jgi:hypothetical protein
MEKQKWIKKTCLFPTFTQHITTEYLSRVSMILCQKKHQGCGLYYEIYESRFIGLLRHHLSQLNESDAEKLRRYAESQGTKIDDETYHAALNAERECLAEIAREQM